MKTQEYLNKVKNFDDIELKEYIKNNLSFNEVIDTLINITKDYPQEEKKNDIITLSPRIYDRLYEVLDNTFKRAEANGRGRMSDIEKLGYEGAVEKLLSMRDTTNKSILNFKLKNLHIIERERRIMAGQDVSNFKRIVINRNGEIENYTSLFSPFDNEEK